MVDSVDVDVVVIRWPAEEGARVVAGAAGRPRLLLVADDEVPSVEGCLEDWIRVPAPDADLEARVVALAARAREHVVGAPALDDDGLLRYRGRSVAVPPVEARLTAALIERFGSVVGRDALTRAAWPEGSPGRNALDVHVLRLRRRLAPVGLVIRTVRRRGYALEPTPRA